MRPQRNTRILRTPPALSLVPVNTSNVAGSCARVQWLANRGFSSSPVVGVNVGDFNTPQKPLTTIDWDSLGFGLTKVDHMYISHTVKGTPFSKGELVPYGPLSLEPAATVLNYGQGLFEGIKDRIVVFRPNENSKRLNKGASRFLMPPVPEELFLRAIDEVVRSNSQYVPPLDRGALYLRPILFGSGAALGVAPSHEYTFCVWASPVGSYFKGGKVNPIALVASTSTHRASPKGSGDVKAIGNYGPCFLSQKTAKDQGFAEVLFLDAKEEKYVEEAGASNFFCVLKDRTIVTPGLLGTILPGVTRASIIQLMRDKGFTVIDNRRLSLSTVCSAAEAFCSGTGASVTPVGSITHEGKKYTFSDGKVGEVTKEVTKSLLDIQMERVPDTNGWLHYPFPQV